MPKPKGRRPRGSGGGDGGGRDSSSGRGGGRGPAVRRGGGAGAGRGYFEQQQQAAEAMLDIASSLGFQCSINYGGGLEHSPQMQFMLACSDGNLRHLKALVAGMDEDDQESLASVRTEGVGALHAAAMKGKLDICKYLVEELKFDVNSAARDNSGSLTFAVTNRQMAVVRYLLDKGADPDKQDHNGFAPLHDAAREGFDDIAQLLLSCGASVDISSPEGTPLHAAAAFGKISIMQILLEHRANVNKVSVKLCTPMAETLLATPERLDESTCLKCIKFLVKAGADLNSRNPETPLVIATIKGLEKCVEYLLKAGADANIPANDVGTKPIEIAAESGSRKLVEILFPFTSPIHGVSNWNIDGIISYAKSRDSKDKVNPSGNDSKVQLKVAKKQDDAASMPHPEDKPTDKDKKPQLKQQGGKAVEAKDYASALKFYSEAINLDPADAVMYSNRSFCHLKMGRGKDALADANSCIRLQPEWTKGYYRKGAALMSLKEYTQACDAFMVGVKRNPTNEEMVQAFWEAAEAMKKNHSAAKSLDSFD